MASNNENLGATFGATIISTASKSKKESTPAVNVYEAPALTSAPSNEDLNDVPSNRSLPAYSPFYEHERPPLDRAMSRDAYGNEKDLEPGLVAPNSDSPFTSRVNVSGTGCKEDGMWPSKQTLLRGRMAEKKRRRDRKLCGGCGPVVEFWGRRSKRQRLMIKLGIALLVVGLAVTIGLCISIAVHGGVYVRPGQQQNINVPS